MGLGQPMHPAPARPLCWRSAVDLAAIGQPLRTLWQPWCEAWGLVPSGACGESVAVQAYNAWETPRLTGLTGWTVGAVDPEAGGWVAGLPCEPETWLCDELFGSRSASSTSLAREVASRAAQDLALALGALWPCGQAASDAWRQCAWPMTHPRAWSGDVQARVSVRTCGVSRPHSGQPPRPGPGRCFLASSRRPACQIRPLRGAQPRLRRAERATGRRGREPTPRTRPRSGVL